MAPIHALDLGRLRLGLLSLVFALLFDVVDVEYDDFDVLYDGVAVLFFLGAALGIGQPDVRVVGAFPPLAWAPFIVRTATFGIELFGPTWARRSLVELVLFLAFAVSLVLLALACAQVTKGAGLVSSDRWRRTALRTGLLILVPGLAAGLFTTSLVAEFPFRHYVGRVDAAWWKTVLTWTTAALGTLAAFDMTMSSLATAKSVGRRIAE